MRYAPFLLALLLGAAPAAAQAPRGFDPANMDTSVSPCADFYQYAVGDWVQRTTIPLSMGSTAWTRKWKRGRLPL